MLLAQRQVRPPPTINMTHNPLEDLRLVAGVGTELGIQVLQLDLLAAEVVGEAPKCGAAILFALLIIEVMVLDPLPHEIRLLFEARAHLAPDSSSTRVVIYGSRIPSYSCALCKT